MTSNLLYVVEGDKESEEAINILTNSRIQFKRIFVGKEGNGKSMWRDIGTTITPTLISASKIFVGIDEIKSYVNKVMHRK